MSSITRVLVVGDDLLRAKEIGVRSDLDKPPVNEFLLQWFVNYNMKKGWYLTTAPIITANWRAPGGSVWTVPFGGGVGRIMKLGFQPVNITAQL